MAYSIVQTIENKKPYLTVVPNNWIVENGWAKFISGCADGISAKADGLDALYWPPEKVSDLLRRPESTPQPSWKVMKCKIKRAGLEWVIANETQEKMMAISETEEDVNPENTKKRKIDRMRASGLTNQNFKSQLRDIKASLSNIGVRKKLLNKFHHKPVHYNKTQTLPKKSTNDSMENQEIPHNIPYNVPPDTSIVESTLKNILDTVTSLRDDIGKRMSALEMRMTSMESKLAAIPSSLTEAAQPLLEESAKIQLVLEKISVPNMVPLNVKSTDEQLFTPTDLPGFSVIDSLANLEKFEIDINDSNYFKTLFNRLKCFNGQCNGSGRTVCYDILDRLFTRSLLAECSWTGIGRQTAKTRFENKHNTVKLFCDVVLAADPTFSVSQCEDFLKKQLRNSTARLKSKLLRRPTQRMRGLARTTTLTVDGMHSNDMYDSSDTIIITCPSEITSTDLEGKLVISNLINTEKSTLLSPAPPY